MPDESPQTVGPPNLGGPFPKGAGKSGGGIDWNPVAPFISAFDWGAGQTETLVTWSESEAIGLVHWSASKIAKVGSVVVSFVEDYVKAVENVIMRTVSVVHLGLQLVNTAIADTKHWAEGAVNFAEHAAVMVAGWVSSGVQKFDHDVLQPAIAGIESAARTAAHETAVEFTGVRHEVATIAHDVESGVKGVTADITHAILHTVDDAVATLEHDVIDPLKAQVATMAKDLAGVASIAGGDLASLVDDLILAADWIVWMAEHSFTDLEGLLSGVSPAGTPAQLEAGAVPPKGTQDAIDEVVTAFYGKKV